MKIDCKTIEDLIPLYIDKVCNQNSKLIVEQHIAKCDKCRKLLSDMSTNTINGIDEIIPSELTIKNYIIEYNNKIKLQLINIFIFIIATISFWINFIIMQHVWLYSYDKIYTIFQILSYVLMGVIILSVIKVLLQLKNKKLTKSYNKNIIILILMIVMLTINCHYWIKFEKSSFQTEGFVNVIYKNETDTSYNFTIINPNDLMPMTFQCDKDVYNNLIIDENVSYKISFRSIHIINIKGALCFIDTTDTIDNRNK